MYEAFYRLQERPFELTPNPRFLLLTEQHREALSLLQYGIRERKSITMVLGPPGTGKTTLIRAALSSLDQGHTAAVCLTNPALTRAELLEALARGFQLGDAAIRSKAAFLEALEARLKERREAGRVTALIVDEAQAMPDDCLEEIRLLLNLESEEDRLLPVVLVGQSELADRLKEPSHAAIKQRVALRCELRPLTTVETAQYIATRIRAAGGTPSRLFTREAVDLVHDRSQGIPRAISVICDNALVTGLAVNQQPIGAQLVADVCRDLDIGDGPSGAVEPPRTTAALVPAPQGPRPAAALEPLPAVAAARPVPELFRMFGRR